MTLDEFARRWLTDPHRSLPASVRALHEDDARRTVLTEAALATFRERPPHPPRGPRIGRRLVRWSLAAAAASLLFAAGAVVILKLGPYVQDYATLYLVE